MSKGRTNIPRTSILYRKETFIICKKDRHHIEQRHMSYMNRISHAKQTYVYSIRKRDVLHTWKRPTSYWTETYVIYESHNTHKAHLYSPCSVVVGIWHVFVSHERENSYGKKTYIICQKRRVSHGKRTCILRKRYICQKLSHIPHTKETYIICQKRRISYVKRTCIMHKKDTCQKLNHESLNRISWII